MPNVPHFHTINNSNLAMPEHRNQSPLHMISFPNFTESVFLSILAASENINKSAPQLSHYVLLKSLSPMFADECYNNYWQKNNVQKVRALVIYK